MLGWGEAPHAVDGGTMGPLKFVQCRATVLRTAGGVVLGQAMGCL
jgi:hypothetical protein